MLSIASRENSSNQSATGVGITEIVLPNAFSAALYLPSLAFLSRESTDRWLTWLVPAGVTKASLQHYGFDLTKTRFIYPKSPEHCFALLREALLGGNSHTVVGSPGKMTEDQILCLEQAAKAGCCYGLLLRERLCH
jgi:cell division inhibitor SulA